MNLLKIKVSFSTSLSIPSHTKVVFLGKVSRHIKSNTFIQFVQVVQQMVFLVLRRYNDLHNSG